MPVKKTNRAVAKKAVVKKRVAAKVTAKKTVPAKKVAKAASGRSALRTPKPKPKGASPGWVHVVPATLRFDVNNVIWLVIQRQSNGIRIGPPRPGLLEKLANINVGKTK